VKDAENENRVILTFKTVEKQGFNPLFLQIWCGNEGTENV